MKTHKPRLLTMLALGMSLSITAAMAEPQKAVAIPLGGKSFGVFVDPGGVQRSKNLLATSLPNNIILSNTYRYSLAGTIRGDGGLKNLVAPGTRLRDFLEAIKPGSSAFLEGTVTTTDGTLIRRKTITGNRTMGPVTVGVSLTVGAKINPDGEVRFAVTDVKITAPVPVTGAIVFEGPTATRPGSRLAVASVPPPAAE